MRPANFEYLKNQIIQPGMDKHLLPLMLYRGSRSFGRMTRLWNFAITCMESEVENYTEAVKLSHNPDFAHLCGTIKPLSSSSLPGLFGRLRDHPSVTDNIPRLTRYVRELPGHKFHCSPVDLYTNRTDHPERVPPWRIHGFSPERAAEIARDREERIGDKIIAALNREYESDFDRAIREYDRLAARFRREQIDTAYRAARVIDRDVSTHRKSADRMLARRPLEGFAYPFLAHRPKEGDAERRLVVDVNNAVPKHLPDWLRADICQDLIVAILSGEIRRDELQGSIKEYAAKVFKAHPIKYGPLSLDHPIFDDGNTTLADTISNEEYRERLGWDA